MKHKYAVWGLAGVAFLVTLGITSWKNGLWSSDEQSAQPGGAVASHSVAKPNPVPKDPFQAAVTPRAAPPQAQTTQSQPEPQPLPEPIVGNVSSPPDQDTYPTTAPDPTIEQARDEYKQREKVMEELAAQVRSRAQ